MNVVDKIKKLEKQIGKLRDQLTDLDKQLTYHSELNDSFYELVNMMQEVIDQCVARMGGHDLPFQADQVDYIRTKLIDKYRGFDGNVTWQQMKDAGKAAR